MTHILLWIYPLHLISYQVPLLAYDECYRRRTYTQATGKPEFVGDIEDLGCIYSKTIPELDKLSPPNEMYVEIKVIFEESGNNNHINI